MNESPFEISGKERRELKKKASSLRSFIKNFWYYHQLDKDMAGFYGSGNGFPMNDEDAKVIYERNKRELNSLEKRLARPKTTP